MTKSGMELWENTTEANAVVKVKGAGGILRDERVEGRRKLHITPEDRRINQEACMDKKNDVFTNGMLIPVRLIDPADEAEFAANPNLMTEADMTALVKGHAGTFAKRLKEVTNVLLVKRWIEIAKESDASFKRIEALEGRLNQLRPTGAVHSTSSSADTD